jgi:hypothetical protein
MIIQDVANVTRLLLTLDRGTQDTALSDTGQGVLYGTFAIMGFFAGSINVR